MNGLIFEVRDQANVTFATACLAVTECLLLPLEAAVEGDPCSALVEVDTFIVQLGGPAKVVRVAVRGVDLHQEFLLAEDTIRCCSRHGMRVVRLDVSSEEHLGRGLLAFMILCFTLMLTFSMMRTWTCVRRRRAERNGAIEFRQLATGASLAFERTRNDRVAAAAAEVTSA